MADEDPVLLEVKGGVAVISLNRPDKHNVVDDAADALFFRYLAKDRISVSIGSLDEPGRVKPVSQYGSESRLPAFFELAGLPEEPTEPELRPISHQHPDHD